jgi:two-component system, cell cycle response regulator DivK
MIHRVMIVEPDRLHMKMLNDILVARGFETQKVDDPGNALALVRQQRSDLMLVSLEFPDEGGLELIRSIKSDPKLKNTMPVIVVSDFASSAEMKLLHQSDCYDVITKPVDLSQLFSAVEGCLGLRAS